MKDLETIGSVVRHLSEWNTAVTITLRYAMGAVIGAEGERREVKYTIYGMTAGALCATR